jgi:hypothetical protein
MPLAGAVTRTQPAGPPRTPENDCRGWTFPFPDELCQAAADPSEPYAVFVVMAIRHASGHRITSHEVRWGFGHGPVRNNAGSCINLRALWNDAKYASLRQKNPQLDEAAYHELVVHVQAWASPGLLNFVLRAMAQGRLSEVHNVHHLRAQLHIAGLPPVVNERLPIDPADWEKHPLFALAKPEHA